MSIFSFSELKMEFSFGATSVKASSNDTKATIEVVLDTTMP